MVDLGQKGWKQFHLFYFIKKRLRLESRFLKRYVRLTYFSIANRLDTSAQFITLKKASI